MWSEIGLIGRDRLLMEKIAPRLRAGKGFVLTGQHGIGKTALLQWSYEHAEGRKAYVSCATQGIREILDNICVSWGVEVRSEDGEIIQRSRWKTSVMFQSILEDPIGWLFVDDVHVVTPTIVQKFKQLRDRGCKFVCGGVPPFKKTELVRLFWGIPCIKVEPIGKPDMMRLANLAAGKIGSTTSTTEAVHSARGIPAHLFHALRGEVTPDAVKIRDEEFDIAFVVVILFAAVAGFRYLSRGMDSTSMVMLGGVGMAAASMLRYFLFKGIRK
jgi:hypothetical protein